MNYGELISEAFGTTWRNRYLWFFGFFAASGGSFNLPSTGTGTGTGDGGSDDFDFGPNTPDFGASLVAQTPDPSRLLQDPSVPFIVGLGVLVLLLVVLFLVLGIVSSGGLAASVAAIHAGERRGFRSTFGAGWRNFWRILGQAIVIFLIALGLLLAIGLPVALLIFGAFLGTESVGVRVTVTVLAVLLAIVLLLLVFVPFYIVGQLALRELVVGRGGIVGSIGRGFGLFRRNLGRSLLVWLIAVGLAIAIGIAVLIVLILLGLILVGPGVYLISTGSNTAGVVASVVGGLIFLVPYLLISGAVGTFKHSYWTLAYLRLVEPPPIPAAVGGEPGYPPAGTTATA